MSSGKVRGERVANSLKAKQPLHYKKKKRVKKREKIKQKLTSLFRNRTRNLLFRKISWKKNYITCDCDLGTLLVIR